MNKILRIISIGFPLALVSFLHAAAPSDASGPKPLLSVDFNKPTELTYNFPPLPGTTWTGPMNNQVSVVSNNGQAKVLFGATCGNEGSGGLHVEVDKPATVFMQMNYDRVTLFKGDPATLTLDQLRALQLRFDAKIPAGNKLEVYCMLIVPKEWKQQAWTGRLPLGEVAGTGDFKSYELSGASASATALQAFLALAQKHGSENGVLELKVNIAFKLVPIKDWPAGSGFDFDNLVLTQGAVGK